MLNRFFLYLKLIRLAKPTGIFLLLWPTLNALWIASNGLPPLAILLIFMMGTVLMRSAGCAINDYADRDIDRYVERTKNRPLTAGKLRSFEALMIAAILACFSFLLIWPLNALTKWLALAAVLIAASYPYIKRFFAVPQAYLGIAFSFGIPMAFAAIQNEVPPLAWILMLANILWTIAYDTVYAMVDRDDDIKLSIRTSAITFGENEVFIIIACHVLFLTIYGGLGMRFNFSLWFWIGWLVAAVNVLYQFKLINERDRLLCFKAFKHNNWLGAALFFGIAAHYFYAAPISIARF